MVYDCNMQSKSIGDGGMICIKNWGVYNPDSSSKHTSTSSRKNSGYAQSSFCKVLEVWQCQTGLECMCLGVPGKFLGTKVQSSELHGGGLQCRREIDIKNSSTLSL